MEFMLSILIRLNFFSACACELTNRIILENTKHCFAKVNAVQNVNHLVIRL